MHERARGSGLAVAPQVGDRDDRVTMNRNTHVPTRMIAVERRGPQVGRVVGGVSAHAAPLGAAGDAGRIRLDGEHLVGRLVAAVGRAADASADRARGGAQQRQGRENGDQHQCEQRLDRHGLAPDARDSAWPRCADRTRSAEIG